MIQTIRIGHAPAETVATPYRDLVTRPTGAAVRDRIEERARRVGRRHRPARLLRRRAARLQLRRRGGGQAAAATPTEADAVRRAAGPARGPARGDRARARSTTGSRRSRCRAPTARAASLHRVGSRTDAREAFGCLCERGGAAAARARPDRSVGASRAGGRPLLAGVARPPSGARRTARSSSPSPSHDRTAPRPLHTVSSRRRPTAGPTGHPSSPRSSRAPPSSTRSAPTTRCCTPGTATTRIRWRSARKYALLEGAEAAVFLSSGMGATALAHLAVLRPGDHLLASSWIYGGTRRALRRGVRPVRHRGHLRRPGPASRSGASRCGSPPAPSSSRRRPIRSLRIVDLGADGPGRHASSASRCWSTRPSPARSTSGRSSTAPTSSSPAPPSTSTATAT